MKQLDEYQEKAYEFALESARTVPYMVMGIAGEVGELSSWYAKATRDGWSTRDFTDVKKELGDILWFVAGMCSLYGLKMSDIAKLNIDKLQSRKERSAIQGDGDNR